MKKRIALAAGVLSLLLITGCSRSDFDYTEIYELVTVTGYKNETAPTDLVIPSEINNKSVDIIGPNAFRNQSSIRTVALPSNLKKIKKGAFENCINLLGVAIPTSVTELEGFMGCSSLTTLSMSNAPVEIKQEAFKDCSSLRYISFSSLTTAIGDSAFENCSAIEQITLGENIQTIGNKAFANCTSLKSIEIRGADTNCSIALDAFSGCTNIENVTMTQSFIDSYIVSSKAPAESPNISLFDKIAHGYKRVRFRPICFVEEIPSVKTITVDGIVYTRDDFLKYWLSCWHETLY